MYPLHEAAQKGDAGQVRILLGKEPNLVSTKDNNGRTPLHLAAREGHKNVVEVLLSYKADVNAKDPAGWTPLRLATRWGHQGVSELLRQHGGQGDVEANASPKFKPSPHEKRAEPATPTAASSRSSQQGKTSAPIPQKSASPSLQKEVGDTCHRLVLRSRQPPIDDSVEITGQVIFESDVPPNGLSLVFTNEDVQPEWNSGSIALNSKGDFIVRAKIEPGAATNEFRVVLQDGSGKQLKLTPDYFVVRSQKEN